MEKKLREKGFETWIASTRKDLERHLARLDDRTDLPLIDLAVEYFRLKSSLRLLDELKDANDRGDFIAGMKAVEKQKAYLETLRTGGAA